MASFSCLGAAFTGAQQRLKKPKTKKDDSLKSTEDDTTSRNQVNEVPS
jgi:hypothetical protein